MYNIASYLYNNMKLIHRLSSLIIDYSIKEVLIRITPITISLILYTTTLYSQTPEIIIQDGHSSRITAITSNGDEFATVDASGILIIWDANSKMIKEKHHIGNIPQGSFRTQRLKFSPNNSIVNFNTHDFTDFRYPNSNSFISMYNRDIDSISYKSFEEQDFYINNNNAFIYLNKFTNYNGVMLLNESYVVHQLNTHDSGFINIGNLAFKKRITCIAVSENSEYLAIGFENGSVKAYKTKDMQLIWEERDYGQDIFNIVFIPHNNQIAYCGKSEETSVYGADYIIVRDILTGKKQKAEKPDGDDNQIEKVVVSSDGKYLAAKANYPLIIWDTKNYNVIYNDKPSMYFDIHTFSAINDLAFISGKDEILLCSENAILYYDIKNDLYSSNVNYSMNTNSFLNKVGFYGESSYYISNSRNRTLDFYDLSTLNRESYNSGYWWSLLKKYSGNEEVEKPLSFPYLWGGYISSWNPNDSSVTIWGTPKFSDNNQTNYFLQFNSHNWKLKSICGPLEWTSKQQDNYNDFMHYDPLRNYIIMRGNMDATNTKYFTHNIYIINAKNGKEILHKNVISFEVSPNGNYLGIIDNNQILRVFKTSKFKEILAVPISKGANNDPFQFVKEHQLVYITLSQSQPSFITDIVSVDLINKDQDTLATISNNHPTCMYMKDNMIALGFSYDYTLDKWKNADDETINKLGFDYFTDNNILMFDFKGDSIIKRYSGDKTFFADVVFNDKLIIAKKSLKGLLLLPIDKNITIKQTTEKKEDLFNTKNYYTASKGMVHRIGIKANNNIFPVENFDLLYNRPDKILDYIGYSDKDYLEAINKSRLKRFARNNINIDDIETAFDISTLPIIKFMNKDEIKPVTNTNKLKVELLVRDSLVGISKYQIFINNIPIFADDGKLIDTKPNETQIYKERLTLTEGDNKIKIVAWNNNNIKSTADFFSVLYQPTDEVKRSLYLITIGISEYLDSTYTLKYAAKDAIDIQTLYNQFDTIKSSYGGDPFIMEDFSFPKDYIHNIHRLKITNKQAIKDNILKIKTFLNNSNEEDIVMVFLSGHGMLDQQGNYYFATYNMNFHDPAKDGIPYEEIILLLNGIPARKRILFMDTCHSGDLDEAEDIENKDITDFADSKIIFSQTKGARVLYSQNQQTYNSFELMKEKFIDFNYKGVVVISASGGLGFALEDEEWSNGVFTYALISGINDKTADKNGDRIIMISELKEHILNEVKILTNGMQKPTTREENIEFDFRVW